MNIGWRLRMLRTKLRERLRGLKRWLRPRLGRWARELLRDIHLYGGLAVASYGAHLIYDPAGYVTAGTVLTLIGVIGLPQW